MFLNSFCAPCPCFHLLYNPFLHSSSVMSSLLSQTMLLIHLLVFLSIKMDYPFTWRMLSLKICWLFWTTWPFRAAAHRSPQLPMKKPKPAHMKSKVSTLLLAFFTPFKMLISISWSWIQPTHQTQQLEVKLLQHFYWLQEQADVVFSFGSFFFIEG